ncbi:MAG: hypothetical protein ACRDNZ_02525 [Streptosporangiaceae bacterium]
MPFGVAAAIAATAIIIVGLTTGGSPSVSTAMGSDAIGHTSAHPGAGLVGALIAEGRHASSLGTDQHAAPAHQSGHPHGPVQVTATARTSKSPAPTPAPAHASPYLIYDSVTPSAIPAGPTIATYATGPFAVPASQVAGRHVLWIDTNGSDPAASILDVEPGDATPAMAASWAQRRLSTDPGGLARIYTMISEWPATQAAVASLPASMRSRIRWWIADPTGTPHLVPGSDATQWSWGQSFDVSTATPGF